MKDEFLGFYAPTKGEIDKAWKEGTFVFDTNVLLNLYRYSEKTRKDFLLVMSKVKDRIFLPHQVGLEYHSNRLSTIEGLENSYSALLNGIKSFFEKSVKDLLNQFKRHPSIEIDRIITLMDEFIKKVSIELDKQRKNHPDFVSQDVVLKNLTELFKGKIGKQFTREELKKIFQEGKDRYEQQIPPGYKDQDTKKKKGEQHVFGDLIIWKEIIRHTIKDKNRVVLVTDDRKEDWWTIENGKTIRPREELIKEFYDLTKIRVLIYNADQFLHFAKERKLATNIKEASVTEIKEVRKTDESINRLSDILKSHEINVTSQIYNPLSEYLKASSLKNAMSPALEGVVNGANFNLASQLTSISDALRGQNLSLPVSQGLTSTLAKYLNQDEPMISKGSISTLPLKVFDDQKDKKKGESKS
jgi:hypothetical protein